MLDDQSRVNVHMSMNIRMAPYENAECDIMLTGLRPDTTPEDVDHLLDVAKISYDKMKVKIASQVNEIRKAYTGA